MKTKTFPLSPFCRAYLVTALWSSTDGEGNSLDLHFSIADFAMEAFASASSDCAAFEANNAETIKAAIATGKVKCGPDFDETERAGHDFWLTRCRHGCGFWDGDWPKPYAQQLTDAARIWGNVDLYIRNDGKLYFS